MEQSRQRWLMRLGLIVFALGTVLNIVELTLALTVQRGILVPILVMALFDAALIAYVFMHITQLWRPEHPQE